MIYVKYAYLESNGTTNLIFSEYNSLISYLT